MVRAIEPPMHVDSELSAAIQFADWVAAVVSRAVEYQLLVDDGCSWVGEALWPLRHRLFTKESKVRLLPQRSVDDLFTWDLLKRERPLEPAVARNMDPEAAQKMEQIFQKGISRE